MQPTRQQIETFNKNFKLVEEVEITTTFSTKLTHDAFSEVDYLLDAPWEKEDICESTSLGYQILTKQDGYIKSIDTMDDVSEFILNEMHKNTQTT